MQWIFVTVFTGVGDAAAVIPQKEQDCFSSYHSSLDELSNGRKLSGLRLVMSLNLSPLHGPFPRWCLESPLEIPPLVSNSIDSNKVLCLLLTIP